MPEGILQKVHLLIDEAPPGAEGVLSRVMSGLFPHVNLTCNLYLIAGDLPESLPEVERIQEAVNACLWDNLFLRFYVHLVHAIPKTSLETVKQCYHHLKRMTHEFDEEGYQHQELPRLMLLPLLVPAVQVDSDLLKDFLDTLKGQFLMPGLYLDDATAFLSQDDFLLAKTEKVYQGSGDGKDMEEVLISLCEQNIFEESCDFLASGASFVTEPCSSGLIVSLKNGFIYPCMEAFRKKEGLAALSGEADMDDVVARCDEHVRNERDCVACRETIMTTLVNRSLPQDAKHEVGALLYHFGTFRQEAESHVQAIQDYQQSMKVSPADESSSVDFRLGLSHTRLGDFDRAIEAFQRAESTYQGHDYFHFHLGMCHFEKGDYQSALEAFTRAAALNPHPEDLVRILIYVGTCHNYLGQYEKAGPPLEQAKEIAPDVQEIYNTLGFSYFQLKDFDRAIENLRRAVEIDPHSAIDYASLGANYREKGDVPMAIAMFEKALSIDPTITSVQENLERLKDVR
jgi:Tfp pilus assembly protein PilF